MVIANVARTQEAPSCPSVETIGYAGTECSGLLIAQTFESELTGWIQSISVSRCTASETVLSIRELAPNASNILQGTTIYTSDLHPAVDPLAMCSSEDADYSNYSNLTLNVTEDSVALSPGITYVLVFDVGFGAGSCPDDPYSAGISLGEFGPQFDTDLIFSIAVCEAEEDEIVFGCNINSPEVCNYNPLANANDGSCILQDCMGVCGGSAHIVPDCGCVDGTSPLQASDCYGCTNPSACNYMPIALDDGLFIPPFDDGSCADLDCNGDCAGLAELTACGCIGGNSGINGQCIDGCLTDDFGPAPGSCAPYFMVGQLLQPQTSGILRRVGIDVCCATNAQFIIREAPANLDCETGTSWSEGDTLYVSAELPAICSGFTNCITPSGNATRYWNIDDFPIEGGQQYVFELIQGVAGSRCEDSEFLLQAFDIYNEAYTTSMGINLNICTDGVGCTDPEASNFDATATAPLNSACIYPDCADIIGGPHVILPGCGCTDVSDEAGAVRCIDDTPAEVAYSDGPACEFLLKGQTWIAPVTGHLRSFQVHADSTADFTLTLTVGSGPLAGTTLAHLVHTGAPAGQPCAETDAGWITFEADSIPLEAGIEYVITSSITNLYSNCSDDYEFGHGIQENGASAQDIRFRAGILEDPTIIWGCQDQSKCNYLSSATHDSGLCYDYDCLGQCPDVQDYEPATYVELCGCVGGPDSLKIIDEANCFGCTDPSACNYGAQFISDDGSCNPRDCNGDCLESNPELSGLAHYNPACGCVGGNVVDGDGNPVTGLTCSDRCQGNAISSNLASGLSWSTYLSNGGIQSLTIDTTTFVTGIELYQITPPTNIDDTPFSIEVAVGTSGDWSSATAIEVITCAAYATVDVFPGYSSYSLYFPLESVVEITPETHLFFKLGNGNWSCPITSSDAIATGVAYQNETSSALQEDMFLSIYGCSDLYGCTDPSACNFDDWATLPIDGSCEADCDDPTALNYNPDADLSCTNNEYCQFNVGCTDAAACNFIADAILAHPYTGYMAPCVYAAPESCLFCPTDFEDLADMSDQDRVLADADQDGICDADEIAGCLQPSACNYHDSATDPAPCVFANTCGECSGETDGTGYLLLSNDADNDGICDQIDLCINLDADNFDSPLNEPCRGTCDTAPIMDTAFQISPASGRYLTDGQLAIHWHHGDMPNLSAAETAIDRIVLTGLKGSPDVEIDANAPPYLIPPGLFEVRLVDADGCTWVSETHYGSTFQQPPTHLVMFVGYVQCCGGCGIYDADTDSICDDADNCTDRRALNYSDPGNLPCIYPE